MSKVFNFSQIIYFELDAARQILELSPAAENYLGKSLTQLRGQNLKNALPEGHPLLELISRQGQFSLYDQRLDWLSAQGQVFDLHQISSEDGVQLFLYPKSTVFQKNISDQTRGVRRQTAAMAAMLAHEIRNPLGSIKGAVQLLQMDAAKSDHDMLNVIEEEGARIGRMVNAFEDLAGDAPPALQNVNIHQTLDSVLRAARAGFGADIRFEPIYDPSLPEVSADPDRLQRALTNIVKNAAEAIAQRYGAGSGQGRIQLRTRYRRGYWRNNAELPVEVAIADNGPGMDENLLSDAFKPFVTTKTNGTGLGLSMVAGIVSEIGGVLEVENLNQGCEFRVLLPIWRG